MIYLVLFWEFCKIGLLAIGGGLVTIPFLMELTDKYDWFSKQQLADMIAVSESTPGPIGVNMATYGGFNAAGIWGGLAATLGLVFPSLVVIVLISKYEVSELSDFSEYFARHPSGGSGADFICRLYSGRAGDN